MQPIELTRYTFEKNVILSAPEEERHLFLLVGHLLNELNVLFRLFVWSYRYHSKNEILAMGGLANQAVTIVYFISKVSEGWDLINERFTQSIQKSYISSFSEESQNSYEELKLYFKNRKSPIQKVRNNFGFHNYDDKALILEALNAFPAKKFDIFLNDLPGFCLFHVSELMISLGLARTMDENIQTVDQYKEGFPKLVDDTIRIHKHLQNVLLGFQLVFVEKYIKEKCESSLTTITPETKFEDIRIPFFIYPPTSDLDKLT